MTRRASLLLQYAGRNVFSSGESSQSSKSAPIAVIHGFCKLCSRSHTSCTRVLIIKYRPSDVIFSSVKGLSSSIGRPTSVNVDCGIGGNIQRRMPTMIPTSQEIAKRGCVQHFIEDSVHASELS